MGLNFTQGENYFSYCREIRCIDQPRTPRSKQQRATLRLKVPEGVQWTFPISTSFVFALSLSPIHTSTFIYFFIVARSFVHILTIYLPFVSLSDFILLFRITSLILIFLDTPHTTTTITTRKSQSPQHLAAFGRNLRQAHSVRSIVQYNTLVGQVQENSIATTIRRRDIKSSLRQRKRKKRATKSRQAQQASRYGRRTAVAAYGPR